MSVKVALECLQALAGVGVQIETWEDHRFQAVMMLQEAPRNRGHVELCMDHHSGQLVAVKAMPLSWVCSSHESFMATYPFENECPWREICVSRYLSRVAGLPFVCNFVGLFSRSRPEVGSMVCLVMSYCRGGDLFSWLDIHAPPSRPDREATVFVLVNKLLRAVEEIHEQGVAHGDLSLENILLQEPPDADPATSLVRIIDFGAATGRTARGLRGKPSYQAPEVHVDADYDAFKADAFSIGVVTFTLAVGNYPWRSTAPMLCPCFTYYSEEGLDAYLDRRKIKIGNEIIALSSVLSPSMVSLLRGLLAVSAEERLTISDALNLSCFQSCADPDPLFPASAN